MKTLTTALLAAAFVCGAAAAHGQVDVPAPVSNTMPTSNFGFNLPTHLGTLSYSLTGSEMIDTGSAYGGGSVYASTALGGNLAYISTSEKNPFSMLYSGGLVLTTLPGNSTAQTYQNLALSQVFRTKSWTFVASDTFSYLPGSPTTGISGIAGTGDIGIYPVQNGLGPSQYILSDYSTRISNGLSGDATWQATASLDFEGSASWDVLHYTGGGAAGINNNDVTATLGPNYRIDARNTVGGEVFYSRASFPGYGTYTITTEGASASYTRDWTRRITTTVSFGPARTTGETYTSIPSQWNLAGSASVNYATRTTGFYANYSRAVNSGSGIIFGALTDSVAAGMSQPIGEDWNFGLQLGYSHNVGLAPIDGGIPIYDATFGGVQIGRRLTQSLSCFGSYTAMSQTENQAASQFGAFNGLNNVFSFGITFAPAPLMKGR